MKYRAIFDDINDLDDLEENDEKLKPYQITLIIFAVMAIILNLTAIIYVNSCKNIYYWSNADYWDMAKRLADGSVGMPVWKAVYQSVLNGEFNYIPSLLPALFARLFGNSRAVFILSVVNCYLLPADFLIYMLSKRLGKAPLITTLIALLSAPITLYMTFNGFTELGGFTLCLLCYYLYLTDNKKSSPPLRYVFIGIILALLILWNSWYLFFSISFITAMTAYTALIKEKPYMCLITLISAVTALTLFSGGYIFKHLLSTYGSGAFSFNILLNLKLASRYLGIIFILAAAVASWFIIKAKDSRPIFIWLQLLICYISFTSTKLHGQGHLLMYVPGLIVLLILAIKNIKTEKILLAAIVLAISQSASVLLPRTQPSDIEEIRSISLTPTFSFKAKKRDSVYDILALKAKLDNIVPNGQYLGVLAYSDILNSDMLKNAEPSLNIRQYRSDYISNTIPYFDLEEINLNPLCNANYMLVAYPAQYVREDQGVLRAAVDSFENWTDIATAYEELYEYATVIDGAEIKLYHRMRDVSEYELAQFKYKLNTSFNGIQE